MKHVLHVITDLRPGGAERNLVQLLKSLDPQRFRSTVLCLKDQSADETELTAELGRLEIAIERLRIESYRSVVAALARGLSIAKRLRPSLIQGWMYYSNLIALPLAQGCGRPAYWTIRGAHVDRRNERRAVIAANWAGGRLSHLPHEVIYNSHAAANAHARVFGYRRGVVIPNGVDTDLFVPSAAAQLSVRQELDVPPKSVLVGLIGRFHPHKDHATFLKAAAYAAIRDPAIVVVLAGHGAEASNASLAELVRRLNLESRIRLLGHRTDVPRITAALDVACSTSIVEGFPNAIAEALSCAVPIVGTDVGDTARIAETGGIIVSPNDVDAVAEAVLRLASDPVERRRLGTRGRARVSALYSIAAMTKRYARLYEASVDAPPLNLRRMRMPRP